MITWRVLTHCAHCAQNFELKFEFPPEYEHNPPGCSEGYTMTGSTVSVYMKCNESDDATDVDEGMVMKQM